MIHSNVISPLPFHLRTSETRIRLKSQTSCTDQIGVHAAFMQEQESLCLHTTEKFTPWRNASLRLYGDFKWSLGGRLAQGICGGHGTWLRLSVSLGALKECELVVIGNASNCNSLPNITPFCKIYWAWYSEFNALKITTSQFNKHSFQGWMKSLKGLSD